MRAPTARRFEVLAVSWALLRRNMPKTEAARTCGDQYRSKKPDGV
jgi:hypothetical protein